MAGRGAPKVRGGGEEDNEWRRDAAVKPLLRRNDGCMLGGEKKRGRDGKVG